MTSIGARALLVGVAAAAILAVPTHAGAWPTFCAEIFNPHGKTTPPAGSTTLPGARGGQNEDGFYQVGSCATTWVCPSLDNPYFADLCYCAPGGATGVLNQAGVTIRDGCTTGNGTLETYLNPDTGTDEFPFGTIIKYTEANGADPKIEAMAGSKQPGSPAGDESDSVEFHLWGQGDMWVCSAEDPSSCICCYVPPDPK